MPSIKPSGDSLFKLYRSGELSSEVSGIVAARTFYPVETVDITGTDLSRLKIVVYVEVTYTYTTAIDYRGLTELNFSVSTTIGGRIISAKYILTSSQLSLGYSGLRELTDPDLTITDPYATLHFKYFIYTY